MNCSNCVTPWKCNGPHIETPDAPQAVSHAAELFLDLARDIRDELNPESSEYRPVKDNPAYWTCILGNLANYFDEAANMIAANSVSGSSAAQE